MKGIYDLIGRIFIGIIFIYEALDTLFFYQQTKETMAEYGIDRFTDLVLVLGLCVLIVGAVLVVIGYYSRVGAFLLLLYWIPYTLLIFDFWNSPPDLQRVNALNFMRNLAVAGGLFLLLANGSAEYSVRRLIHVMKLPK